MNYYSCNRFSSSENVLDYIDACNKKCHALIKKSAKEIKKSDDEEEL